MIKARFSNNELHQALFEHCCLNVNALKVIYIHLNLSLGASRTPAVSILYILNIQHKTSHQEYKEHIQERYGQNPEEI